MSARTAAGPHLLEALVLLGGGRLPLVRQQLYGARLRSCGGTVGSSTGKHCASLLGYVR